MTDNSERSQIPLASKMRVACATTSHDVEEGECPWCTIERLTRESEAWDKASLVAIIADRDRLTVERDQLLTAIGEHVTVRSDQYAEIQRLRAALEAIRIGKPHNGASEPVVIADDALSGEPNPAHETPPAPASKNDICAQLREQAPLVDRMYADQLMRDATKEIERLTRERDDAIAERVQETKEANRLRDVVTAGSARREVLRAVLGRFMDASCDGNLKAWAQEQLSGEPASAHETSAPLTEAETLLRAWSDPLPPNGELYWQHVEKAREYFRRRP